MKKPKRSKTGLATIGRRFPTDFDTVGRVLDAVKEAGEPTPLDLAIPDPDAPAGSLLAVRRQRMRLAIRIQGAVYLWQTTELHEDPRRQSGRGNRAKAIRAAAKELATLIRTKDEGAGAELTDPVLIHQLDARGTADDPLLEPLHTMLKKLVARAAKAEALAGDMAKAPPVVNGGLTAGPAFHKRLVRIFEDTFGEPVAIGFETTGEPFGPFVAFVHAIREELGAPAGPQSVWQALMQAGWDHKQRDGNGFSVFVTPAKASRSVSVRGQERPSRATGRNASGNADGEQDSGIDRRGGRAIRAKPNAAL